MKIALIAHDKKKEDMVRFVVKNEELLRKMKIVAKGTTGLRIMENTNLKLKRMKSGPLGGDQQIGAIVSESDLDMIIFLRDPLTSQPHEPDINALIRLSDVYEIPLATNIPTGQILLDSI